jgi:hypothetical protein
MTFVADIVFIRIGPVRFREPGHESPEFGVAKKRVRERRCRVAGALIRIAAAIAVKAALRLSAIGFLIMVY